MIFRQEEATEETVETKDSSSVEVNYGVIKLQRSKPLPPLPPFKVEVFVVSMQQVHVAQTVAQHCNAWRGVGRASFSPVEVGKMS